MSKIINLIGKRFERLIVIERSENIKERVAWKCQCDCGNTKIVTSQDLKHKKVKSCGCLRKETACINNRKTIKHNKTNTRLYRIWQGIKSRCYYNKNLEYKNYGARGIKICDEWLHDFMNFYDWAMQNGYKEELTIDRINVDGNYEPNNCRWVTYRIQENNRKNNKIIEYKNKKYTLSQLSDFLKIPYATLSWRIKNNWKEEDLTLKPNLSNKYKRNNIIKEKENKNE